MGLGAAFVMPATLSILNAVFPPSERPQAIAAWSAVAGVAIVIGPTLGGFLLSHFFLGEHLPRQRPAGGRGARRRGPRRARDGRALSGDGSTCVGTLLIAVALFAIVDAIIEAPSRGWTGALTLLEAAVGRCVLAGFVAWELRRDEPLIDLRVFANRHSAVASGSVTVIFFALMGSLFVLTQYLQLVQGYSPFGAGVRALPVRRSRWASRRRSPRPRPPGRQPCGHPRRGGPDGRRPARPLGRLGGDELRRDRTAPSPSWARGWAW